MALLVRKPDFSRNGNIIPYTLRPSASPVAPRHRGARLCPRAHATRTPRAPRSCPVAVGRDGRPPGLPARAASPHCRAPHATLPSPVSLRPGPLPQYDAAALLRVRVTGRRCARRRPSKLSACATRHAHAHYRTLMPTRITHRALPGRRDGRPPGLPARALPPLRTRNS